MQVGISSSPERNRRRGDRVGRRRFLWSLFCAVALAGITLAALWPGPGEATNDCIRTLIGGAPNPRRCRSAIGGYTTRGSAAMMAAAVGTLTFALAYALALLGHRRVSNATVDSR